MSATMLCMCTLRMCYFESDAEISGVSHKREITWHEQRWHKAFKTYSEKKTNRKATAGLTWKEKTSVSGRKKRQKCNCLHMSETSASRNGGPSARLFERRVRTKTLNWIKACPSQRQETAQGTCQTAPRRGKKNNISNAALLRLLVVILFSPRRENSVWQQPRTGSVLLGQKYETNLY